MIPFTRVKATVATFLVFTLPTILPAAESMAQSAAAPARRTNSIGMEFVLIPAGSFQMGSPDSDQEARVGRAEPECRQ